MECGGEITNKMYFIAILSIYVVEGTWNDMNKKYSEEKWGVVGNQ